MAWTAAARAASAATRRAHAHGKVKRAPLVTNFGHGMRPVSRTEFAHHLRSARKSIKADYGTSLSASKRKSIAYTRAETITRRIMSKYKKRK